MRCTLYNITTKNKIGYPGGTSGKEPACRYKRHGRFLGQEDPLEEERAPHSSILAWEILWTEKPSRIQSMGSQRVDYS